MTRDPRLRTSEEIKAPKPPKTRARIKKVNAKRKGSRFPKLRDPKYLAWVRQHSCVVVVDSTFLPNWSVPPRIHVAHVVSRGAGGADRGNTVSLCNQHHDEQHRIGIESFQLKHGINLTIEAAKLYEEYLAQP